MPRNILVIIAAAAAVAATAPGAGAQADCRPNAASPPITQTDVLVCQAVQAPTPEPNAPVRSVVPAGFVTAGKDDSEVQIQYGWQLPQRGNWEHALNATATAPLADGPLSPLAEIRGALPGTALEVSLNGQRWPQATSLSTPDWCRQQKRQGTIAAEEECDKLTETVMESKYPALLDAYHAALNWGSPFVYQLMASASYDQHDYVNGTTLAAGSRNLIPFTVSGTIGRFFGPTLLTLNGRYERRFEDGDEVQICTPAGVGEAESCKTAPLGEPESGFNTVVTGQARRFFTQSVAVNLRGSYRVDDDEWSVEAPFYFIPDGDGALIGGIVPGWSSEDDEFTIRLFVGRAFGLKL